MRIATPTAISATPTTVFVCTAGDARGAAEGLGAMDAGAEGVAVGAAETVGDGEGDGEGVGVGVSVAVGAGVGVGVGDGGGGGGVVVRGTGVGVGVVTARSTLTVPCICGWIPHM